MASEKKSFGCKLFVRHLPSVLSNADKTDILKQFGASDVVCMGRNSKMKDSAFAEFGDETSADKALTRLHQIEILGSRLVVEYAKKHHERLAFQNIHRMSPKKEEEEKDELAEESERTQEKERDAKKEKVGGIAPKLGIKYPSNANLCYLYPLPNATVLTNIAHTMACVPKFYVQVLHLMNKMNLPAPFGTVTPTPPNLGDQRARDGAGIESSEESEMESDEEQNITRVKGQPLSRKSQKNAKKRVKLKPTKGPLPKKPKPSHSTKQESIESVFEQPTQQARKIEFNLAESITSIFDAGPPQLEPVGQSMEEGLHIEGFGKFEPHHEPVAMETNEEENASSDENDEFISQKELESNRMSVKELSFMSALKNYSSGDPTSRLYVKNLAKQVEDKELHYIFGRYVDFTIEDEKDRFDIRLMKEGRMKGQAFITLPSEKKAKKALREVHGYILHSKPMVIQFARSAKAKETS